MLWSAAVIMVAGTAAAEELVCTHSGILRSAAAAGSLQAAAGDSFGAAELQNCTFVVGSEGASTALANISVSSGVRGGEAWIFGACPCARRRC